MRRGARARDRRPRPRACFTGHIHARTERRVAGVRVVGLQAVPRRGSVVVVELTRDGVRDLAEWGGAADAPPPEPEFDAAHEALEVVPALAAVLDGWGAAVRAGRAFDRDARKRLHAALAAEPYRAALMGAALGHDARALVGRHVPAEERAALLVAWQAGGLPAPEV